MSGLMTEKEYCVGKFAENFAFLKNEKIAIYGHGANAAAILEKISGYQIVCFVDDNAAGMYLCGKVVVSFLQMLELDIKYLILAAQTRSAEIIYKRIGALCRANRVNVYDMYGNDMFLLHADITKDMIKYPVLSQKDILDAIDAHEIICFDICNTLFSPGYLYAVDLFERLSEFLQKKGIWVKDFANKVMRSIEKNLFLSLEEILGDIGRMEGMTEEKISSMTETVCGELLKTFVPRKAVLAVLSYALAQGKQVCMIEDMQDYRISVQGWKKFLKDYGLENCKLVSSIDYARNKYNGLFRVIKETYGETSYLHIGDDLEADVLVPRLYGMDSFWIKSPLELYRQMDKTYDGSADLDNKLVRNLLGQYILKVYNDVFFVDKCMEKQKQSEALAWNLENSIRTFAEDSGGTGVELILFDLPKENDTAEKSRQLHFHQFENPQVSIIIPVYNQFELTYACLRAILEHTKKISYEVIVADDRSTDRVRELEKAVYGITVLHNKENLGFLLNCNHAAKYAKGKYLLFLNNDTQVQPGWLLPLVDIMERHIDVGMAGSRLVYPDGRLQEAGGILWKDGSAWNYGHLKNPNDPEYNYVKETDYISGASIIIRSQLWKEIGGFDRLFAPAYYEDTDLAFEVRKHGYKVFYQPSSVVVHFEGMSNGTDTETGLKKYQVVNQKKFYEKWKEVLEKEHFKNGSNVYLAKDRGQTKKQMLVVDHYVPNFDQDAGGRCTYMYLQEFLKMGMKVTFIGDNFAKPQPYTDVLNQLGVEVLYGNFYYKHWKEWLTENLGFFDYIYLQRPHIAVKYIDIVKKYSRGKIFYFAHDLHHVRMYRDYLVTGNTKSLQEAEKWRRTEMGLFEKADVGHVVGSFEQALVQKEFPGKPIRNIPLYIYEKMPENIEKDFQKRQDIIFVGGFGHPPNKDAVLWFAKEIYPEILKKYPDIVWHIVGKHAPEEVLALAGDHIVLEGYLTDVELEKLYRRCRLAVVPLRYGAGVKGKVIEAAYYQIPLVTTSIGGEGLDNASQAFVMEDDAGRMAELINDLYCDFKKLRNMSDAGMIFIKKYFTLEVARQVLEADIEYM